MFKGYALKRDYWTYPTPLQSAAEAWKWCKLYSGWVDEIRVTDELDYCVIHIKKGELVFPTREDVGEQR